MYICRQKYSDLFEEWVIHRETREKRPLLTVKTRETSAEWLLLTVETIETKEEWPMLTVGTRETSERGGPS